METAKDEIEAPEWGTTLVIVISGSAVSQSSEEQRARVRAKFRFVAALQPVVVRRSNGATVNKALASCYHSQAAFYTMEKIASYAGIGEGSETLYVGKDAACLFSWIVGFRNKGPVNS